MNKKFVADAFIVPEKLQTDKFRLRMLTVDDVEKDYEAVMSSCEQLRNPQDENSWPKKNMTLEEDLQDLQAHQNEEWQPYELLLIHAKVITHMAAIFFLLYFLWK